MAFVQLAALAVPTVLTTESGDFLVQLRVGHPSDRADSNPVVR